MSFSLELAAIDGVGIIFKRASFNQEIMDYDSSCEFYFTMSFSPIKVNSRSPHPHQHHGKSSPEVD